MIVIDASAMVEALVGRTPATELLDALSGDIAAPHLLDVEVLSALRGLTLGRKVAPDLADAARITYFQFTIQRYEVEPLANRMWELRHQFTSYDASYLALAEALDAQLFTCDAALAGGPHSAQVAVVGSAP